MGPRTIMGEYSPQDEAAELARRREEEELKNHPINVNGHALTLGDMYSSYYDWKDMMTKLKLLDSKPGALQGSGEPDDEPNEGTKAEEKQDVEEQLFGGGKTAKAPTKSAKAAAPKTAEASDGESDMEPYGKGQ